MDYQLAKKLKDAGFPQLAHNLSGWIGENNTFYRLVNGAYVGINTSKESRELYYCPTLSELIAACGKDYFMLENGRTGWGGNTKDWKASKFIGEQQYINTGSTPEEAVANLYLALHPPLKEDE